MKKRMSKRMMAFFLMFLLIFGLIPPGTGNSLSGFKTAEAAEQNMPEADFSAEAEAEEDFGSIEIPSESPGFLRWIQNFLRRNLKYRRRISEAQMMSWEMTSS